MGVRRLFSAAIVGLGLLAYAGSAQACSCASTPAGEALRQADAAFVGKLLKVVPRARAQADYRYAVQRVYKRGAGLRPGNVVSVRSARAGSACGLPSGIGRRYGLLVEDRENRWLGGLCGVLAPGRLRAVAGGRAAGARAGLSCAS